MVPVKLRFLCRNHRSWLESDSPAAHRAWLRSYDHAFAYLDMTDTVSALNHAG